MSHHSRISAVILAFSVVSATAGPAGGPSAAAAFQAPLGTNHKFDGFLNDTDHESLGNELDLTIGQKLGEHASALLKAAYLQGDGSQPDIERLSFQIDYQF